MSHRCGIFVVALAWFIWLCASPHEALAAIERYSVIIGNNAGAPGDVELRYAEADALKVHDVLVGLGGFSPTNMLLLRGADAETARRALIEMNDRIRTRVTGGYDQAFLVVYYSGHADATALHLGKTRLELSQLEQLVRGSSAHFRLLVVDACRSGTLTRVKGGKLAPAVPIQHHVRLAGEGLAFLTSSSANEDAQESDALGGSFFTHYLVSGLLGAADTDRNGAIDLEEAYRYASDATIRATSRTLAGIQHPTFRYELRGFGEIALTSLSATAGQRGIVEVPSGRTYLLMEGSMNGRVVAEVLATDVARRISVKPGRYFVRGRSPDFMLEGEVTVAAGAVLFVKDELLNRVAYARLVRKGIDERHRFVHGPQAGYQIRTAFGERASPCQGLLLGWAFELQHMNVTPRLGACRGGFTNEALTATSDQVDLAVRVSHAWDLPILTLELGVGFGMGIFHQEFSTLGIAPARTSLMGFVGAGLGASVDLPAGWYLLGELEAQAYVFRQQLARNDTTGTIAASFALRAVAGLGWRL